MPAKMLEQVRKVVKQSSRATDKATTMNAFVRAAVSEKLARHSLRAS